MMELGSRSTGLAVDVSVDGVALVGPASLVPFSGVMSEEESNGFESLPPAHASSAEAWKIVAANIRIVAIDTILRTLPMSILFALPLAVIPFSPIVALILPYPPFFPDWSLQDCCVRVDLRYR